MNLHLWLIFRIPPGMSPEITENLMKTLKTRPYADLVTWKLNILTFVDACRANPIIPQEILFPLCLAALCDNNTQLKSKAEGLIRRLDKMDFNDPKLVSQLFS